MKRALYLSTFFAALLFFTVQLTPIFAQTGAVNDPVTGAVNNPTTGAVNNPVSGAVNPSSGFQIQNPLNVDSICGLIKKVLAFILAIGMPVAALFLAYAGFLFISARGNAGKLKDARLNLINVFLGLFIFIGAWLLGQVIANTLKAISPSNAQSVSSCN